VKKFLEEEKLFCFKIVAILYKIVNVKKHEAFVSCIMCIKCV